MIKFLPDSLPTKKPLSLATSIAAASMLVACGTLTPTSLYKLSQFDPLTTAPANLGVAVRSPDQLAVKEGGATITISLPSESEVFTLVGSLDLAKGLSEVEGTRLETFTVAAKDYERLRAIQARAAALKGQSGRKAGGSIAVDAKACRRGNLSDGPLSLVIYLRTEAGDGFFPLTRTIDLRKQVPDIDTDFDALPHC